MRSVIEKPIVGSEELSALVGDYRKAVGAEVWAGRAGAASRRVATRFDRFEAKSDCHAEEFSAAPIGSPELDSLRAALLDIAAHRQDDLDAPGVRTHLTDRGFGATLSRLLSRESEVLEGFAQPGASSEDAYEGFRHVLARHCRIALLRADLRAAEEDLARNMTDEGWDRFVALRRAIVEEGEPDAAEEKAFGAGGSV